jgi:hypothetical protein
MGEERRITVPLIDISPFCTDSDPQHAAHRSLIRNCVDIGLSTSLPRLAPRTWTAVGLGRRFFEPLDMKLSIARQNNRPSPVHPDGG